MKLYIHIYVYIEHVNVCKDLGAGQALIQHMFVPKQHISLSNRNNIVAHVHLSLWRICLLDGIIDSSGFQQQSLYSTQTEEQAKAPISGLNKEFLMTCS